MVSGVSSNSLLTETDRERQSERDKEIERQQQRKGGGGGRKGKVSSGLLQTAQTWANAGVCGGLCACAVGGTFD